MARFSAAQARAIRRRRADEGADADSERRLDIVAPPTSTCLPPCVQVGWMEQREPGGGRVFCRDCRSHQPSVHHVAVFAGMFFATKTCAVCCRRLDALSERPQ